MQELTYLLPEDTAWHPVWKEEFDSFSAQGSYLWMWPNPSSHVLARWLIRHFDLNKFRPNEVKKGGDQFGLHFCICGDWGAVDQLRGWHFGGGLCSG